MTSAEQTISLEDAGRIALERFPERYETYDFGGSVKEQKIDVNKIPRALFVRMLMTKD